MRIATGDSPVICISLAFSGEERPPQPDPGYGYAAMPGCEASRESTTPVPDPSSQAPALAPHWPGKRSAPEPDPPRWRVDEATRAAGAGRVADPESARRGGSAGGAGQGAVCDPFVGGAPLAAVAVERPGDADAPKADAAPMGSAYRELETASERTRAGGAVLADPKLRRMSVRFAEAMAVPPGDFVEEEGGQRVFVKDEIAPSRAFAALSIKDPAARDAIGSQYLDDEGEPFKYSFDASLEPSSHPLDAERQLELRGLDKGIEQALEAATRDMKGGATSTGVRAWHAFCRHFGLAPYRPLDTIATLPRKLAEERLVMRFVMWLVESRDILASTAANYVGSVQGWHLRRTGVKLAAGMRLARVAEMVKGLRRLRGDPGRRVRRGVSPDVLRAQMDAMLDPRTVDGANMRAALSLGFQGLLRGAEFTVRGRQWDPARDMSRADVAELSAERAVVMMLPCKNMQHLNGKTVPLVVGGGGLFIDAPAELRNLLTVDPVYGDRATRTPLFRHADGSAITEAQVRDMIKRLMQRAGASPAEFGAHSLRIGGATALFKAGASQIDIMTMGRWSSDCYRLYVRACFGHAVEWSRKAGSTSVDDVAEEYKEVDCY